MKKLLTVLTIFILALVLVACGGSDENPTVETYTVTFNVDGGSAVSAQTVEKGSKATKPLDPTKANYTFVEWQLDGVKYQFTETVEADITLKAIWQAEAVVTYTVTFDSDGGTQVVAQTVNKGAKATMPTVPTKANHTFVEWQLNGTKYTFNETVEGNITLKAIWVEDEVEPGPEPVEVFTVSFNVDGGTLVAVQEVEEGAKATMPTAPTKANHTFVEWQLNGVTYTFNETVEGNITLKAIWVEDEVEPGPEPVEVFTVSFNVDGGTLVAVQEVEEGAKALEPVEPTKEGFTFVEWQLDGVKYDFDLAVTKDLTLVAVWLDDEVEPEPEVFTVTFNVDGGTLVAAQEVEEGAKALEPANPTKEGFTFVQWQLEGSKYDFDLAVTKDLTLVAIWLEDVVEPDIYYTIIFDTYGGSEIASITGLAGSLVNKPSDPTKEDYTFSGWYLSTDFEDLVSWPLVLEADMFLYAAYNYDIDMMALLSDLFNTYQFEVDSLLPNNLKAGSKVFSGSNYELNYENFVSVNQMYFDGYGEQWQMVLDNLNQAKSLLTVLNIVDSLTTVSVSALSNYLIKFPYLASTFEYQYNNYSITIKYENGQLLYVLDYENNLGFQVQIALLSDIGNNSKIVRAQIGDSNAVKYVISEDCYIISSKYGGTIYGQEGVRTSYISLLKDENNVLRGNIFEELTVILSGGQEYGTSSAAQFIANSNHLHVVGNKADGMLGFDGTILELYDVTSGKLLGYEVEEKLSAITYNTLWFNLDMQTGINNLKYLRTEGTWPSVKDFFSVNNSELEFETKNVGGLTIKNLSRRFYLSMKPQYIYVIEEDQVVSKKISIPMFAVQEEQFNTVSADVIEKNSYLGSFSLNVSSFKDTLVTSYQTNVPIFKDNKDSHTYNDTINFIGESYSSPK